MNAQKEEEKEKKQKNKEEEKKQQQQLSSAGRGAGKFISSYSLAWNHGITDELLTTAARRMHIPDDIVLAWLEYFECVDGCFTTGAKITAANFRRSLRMFYLTEKEMREKKQERHKRMMMREKSRKELHELKMQKIRDGDTRTAKERAADAQEAEINKRTKQWIADRMKTIAESRARRRAQLAGHANQSSQDPLDPQSRG